MVGWEWIIQGSEYLFNVGALLECVVSEIWLSVAKFVETNIWIFIVFEDSNRLCNIRFSLNFLLIKRNQISYLVFYFGVFAV